MIWKELLSETESTLAAGNVPNPGVCAKRLCEQASGYHGVHWPEALLQDATKRCVASLDAMIARLSGGEPLQYVLGSWGFRTLDVFVDKRVLIPRPETEEVAGHAIAAVKQCVAANGSAKVVDLGTGSGVIGLSIAAECDNVDVWLTDASHDALTVARANLAGLGRKGSTVTLQHGDWFEALDADLQGACDVIVSNPPYCAPDDAFGVNVQEYEPDSALVSGPTGLEDLDHIIANAPNWLTKQGTLVVEFAPGQETHLCVEAQNSFSYVEAIKDIAGRYRCLVAKI